jgi:hypothetical protein
MRQKFRKEDLVCLSVSLDAVADKDKTLGFLTKMKAEFPNYLLDEESEFYQAKWDVSGPPLVFVFDRQGRRAAKFEADHEKVLGVAGGFAAFAARRTPDFKPDPDKSYTYIDIEERVKELLKQQP